MDEQTGVVLFKEPQKTRRTICSDMARHINISVPTAVAGIYIFR